MYAFMCERCETISYSAAREADQTPCDRCGGTVHLMDDDHPEEKITDQEAER